MQRETKTGFKIELERVVVVVKRGKTFEGWVVKAR